MTPTEDGLSSPQDISTFLPPSKPENCGHNNNTEPVYGSDGEVVGFECNDCGQRLE